MEENMVMDTVVTENPQGNEPDKAGWIKEMKKAAVKIGWKYFVFGVVVIIAQYIYAWLLPEKYYTESWANFLQIIIPTYCIAFPVLCLLVCKMPKVQIEKKKMGFWKIVLTVIIGSGICGVGMVIGTVVGELITLPFGVSASDNNSLGNLMIMSDPFWRILTVGILAPIFEELIFRKLLIDRVIKYGEFCAIMMSGIMFGLFHGNFAQFFFATGLGMLFAFVYARTGKIWYTILLHMVVNMTTSVITTPLTMKVLEHMEVINKISELSTRPNELMAYLENPEVMQVYGYMMVYACWMMFLAVCALTGVILFFVFHKKFKLKETPMGVKNETVFLKSFVNGGMILFILMSAFLFVLYYVSMILSATM